MCPIHGLAICLPHVLCCAAQEAELFRAWVEVEEAKAAAEEAAAAVVEAEEADVGPTLPGQAVINRAKANLGGFMLPGEGDRWGWLVRGVGGGGRGCKSMALHYVCTGQNARFAASRAGVMH